MCLFLMDGSVYLWMNEDMHMWSIVYSGMAQRNSVAPRLMTIKPVLFYCQEKLQELMVYLQTSGASWVTTCWMFLRRGTLPASCRRAVISLLPKKGDLKSWRPVDLLCSDYKIHSKVLSNRLLIDADQTDNLFLIRDVLKSNTSPIWFQYVCTQNSTAAASVSFNEDRHSFRDTENTSGTPSHCPI